MLLDAIGISLTYKVEYINHHVACENGYIYNDQLIFLCTFALS